MLEEETFYKSLGESIRDFRKKENISQETLAKHLGLSRISVVNIEKGKQKIQIYNLYRIADYLKISMDKLMPLKGVDVINNRVVERFNQTGGDASSLEKLKGFIENLTGNKD